MILKGKRVLITGAAGLVGIPCVRQCLDSEAEVIAVDIRRSNELMRIKADKPHQLTIATTDLTYREHCEGLFRAYKPDIVFNLAGIKGSPIKAKSQPADYFFPMTFFNTNMIKAAYDFDIEWFVYVSSVGVYAPAEVMCEEDVATTLPSQNDWYPAWSKRIGEMAVETLKIQHGWDRWSIIRPSNIYGRHDNFNPDATVIASTVWKLFNTEGDLNCWGDGSAKRDFVYADDVARAVIDCYCNSINDVVNFGCGTAVSIKETIETAVNVMETLHGIKRNIVWDTTKPNGDMLRCLSNLKQIKYNLLPKTSLLQGITNTVKSYSKEHK